MSLETGSKIEDPPKEIATAESFEGLEDALRRPIKEEKEKKNRTFSTNLAFSRISVVSYLLPFVIESTIK